ncbi:uncharacterized protein LOC110116793 [Athalia rosae]|uniref:uncharacterized protein LOC110116793 n=1 Tax=Athalia rosae TaxID=37344 RepID=UPI000A0ED385|nr:uncharacterized protein LOC110116793 [Athalia rosae]
MDDELQCRQENNSIASDDSRSASLAQISIVNRPASRSKLYRRSSLKAPVDADQTKIFNQPRSSSTELAMSSDNESKIKWNEENVHITCNPLSSPYPYSTPCHKKERIRDTQVQDEEPKPHSCGKFLPILSLIPLTLVSFQYLSPKMKFSWWRNKIS